MSDYVEEAKKELEKQQRDKEKALRKEIRKKMEKEAEDFAQMYDAQSESVTADIGGISSEESLNGLNGEVHHDSEKTEKLIELSRKIKTDKPFTCRTLRALNAVVNGKTADELLDLIESGELTFDSHRYVFEKNKATVSGVYGRMTLQRKIELRKMIHASQLGISTSARLLFNLDQLFEDAGARVVKADIGSRKMYLTQREARLDRPSTVYTFTFGLPGEDGEEDFQRWCISSEGIYMSENVAERKDRNFRRSMEHIGFSGLI